MDRDALIASYRKQLRTKSPQYYHETFNMQKEDVVNPTSAWNLEDLRHRTQDHEALIAALKRMDIGLPLPDYDTAYEIEIIHAEIWGRTFILMASLHNLLDHLKRDGVIPTDDPRVHDYIAAINLISLQYGVLFTLKMDSRMTFLLIKDENLKMHVVMGGSEPSLVSSYAYDVALSFAGEDRQYVRDVADALKKLNIRIFFDEFEQAKLWGKDLYQYLNDIYKDKSRLCVIFVSTHYAKKRWTSRELKSAQARAFRENLEFILPVRFDETTLPGLNDTTGYVDGRQTHPVRLAELIVEKFYSLSWT